MQKRLLRTIVAVAIGLVAISVLVEALEFTLVSIVNGGPTTNPAEYYAIRNRGWFLATKLFYNGLAAAGGGYLAAALAGYAPLQHGLAVAVAQTLAFAFALTQPQIRRWAPAWMWAALIVLTFVAVIVGAGIRAKRVNSA